jgi:hypothetical protein
VAAGLCRRGIRIRGCHQIVRENLGASAGRAR